MELLTAKQKPHMVNIKQEPKSTDPQIQHMEFENGIGRSQGEAHDKEPGPNTEDSCFKPVPLQNWFSGILNLKNEEKWITPRPWLGQNSGNNYENENRQSSSDNPPATPEFNVETVRVIIQNIFLKLTNRWAKKTQH